MSVTEEKSLALVAQDHGNHPAVLQSAGFSTEHSANSRSIGYEEEMSPTLRAGVVPAAMMFDNHAQEARHDGPLDISPTVTARYGTGGNNQPLVAEPEPVTLKLRGGCDGGGKGPLLTHDKSATLGCNNDQTLFQPQGFDRYNGAVTGDVAHTLDTGAGNTVPMVSYGIGKPAFTGGEKANFNFAVNEEVAPTMQASGPDAVAKPEIKAYGVCSKSSHAMLSENPKAGFYEAETSRTLDCNGGRPDCSQGGICVVSPDPETYDVRFTSEGTKNARGHCYKTDISRCLDTGGENPDSNHGGVAIVEKEPVAFTQNQRDELRDLGEKSGALAAHPGMKQQTYVLQGSMIGRADKNGPQGDGINEDVSFTLTGTDRHAVAAPAGEHYSASKNSFFMSTAKEQANTLVATDYKDPPILNDTPNDEPVYIVRRLTPVECARLQGFPDWWCDDLEIPEPTDEEITFWTDVWEGWRKLTNPGGKPKTEKQIRKWLASPYTDGAVYKLYGNGVALPIVYFVLSGIAWAANKD